MRNVLLLLIFLPALAVQGQSLNERLGFKATDKVIIINGDDIGMSHAAMDGEELRSMTNSWQTRVTEFELFTASEEISQIIEE